MAYKYTTTDERFGPKEEMTIKEMMLRYRVRGYITKGDGSTMTTNEILEDIYEHGAQCVKTPDFM
jgi:hypothetical protein